MVVENTGRPSVDSKRKKRELGSFVCFTLPLMMLAVNGTAQATQAAVEPRSAQEHTPATGSWPRQPQAPAGAPNVIIVLTDDVGFAASSTFGGVIPTPMLDALAQRGIRYNNFNTTAVCSPTRASLLTGRYPHNVEMGTLVDTAANHEGYTSVIPKSAATIAQIVKDAGYNTAMFGKNHLTPLWEINQSGPFDRWPTGLGFEYYYGFMHGDASQWEPALVENTRSVQPPVNDPNYILDRDLTDQAISWIQHQHAVTPSKPFFMYFASGTAHAPNHSPAEWRAKFRGKFDGGWDKLREEIFARQKALGVIPANTELTPRNPEIPAWDSLSIERKRLAARYMEAYAAQLAFFDAQMARLYGAVRETGELDNTLIIFIQGDNGATGEGGLEGRLAEQSWVNGKAPDDLGYALKHLNDIGARSTYNLYPIGWAWAMNTPFKWFKREASHFGGTRNGLVISWPRQIHSTGLVQSQFAHVSDIAPTILEAIGLSAPAVVSGVKQRPLDGISLAYSFNSPSAPSRRHFQYFEMFQNVAMYKDGWVAATTPLHMPWVFDKTVDLNKRRWELYDVSRDFSQAHDLAGERPEKLKELQTLFMSEAKKNNVLPIHSPGDSGSSARPIASAGRTEFLYREGTQDVDRDAAPQIVNRSFRVDATVEVSKNGQSGVIVAQGGRFGGYALFLKDGRPSYTYNAIAPDIFSIRADRPLSVGNHKISADFASDGGKPGAGGMLTLVVDGQVVGSGRIGQTLARSLPLGDGLDVGADLKTPVSDDYVVPARFSGRISEVRVTLR